MTAGRPLLFKTPEELESAINAYFDECDEGEDVEELNKRGDLVKYRRKIPYTMEGLALALDCESATIRNYAKRDKYFAVVSRARKKIYDHWIRRGLTGDYNPKMAALCVAAHNPEYRVNQQHEVRVLTIEDRLRQIANEQEQIADDIPDAELIEE